MFLKTSNFFYFFAIRTFLLLVTVSATTVNPQTQDERSKEFWNWAEISTDVSFPEDFIWGSAVAEYQVSGAAVCKDSNWAFWEKKSLIEPSGNACDFWSRCYEDIALIKQLGLKAFRFSVDWSLIEPQQGVINTDALEHYELFCKALVQHGIKPVVTLHHFVHPQWFEQLGAFEKEENIIHFVRFSAVVFERLQQYVSLWCTINEPSIYVLGGYIRRVFPPGIFNLHTAGVVLGNLLKSHVAVYESLKALPGGEKAQIGIVHQVLPFKPLHKGGLRGPLEAYIARILNHMLNDSVMNFFKTGTYSFSPPFTAAITYQIQYSGRTLDFFGINNYSHVQLSFNAEKFFSEGYRPDDIKTDMPYPLYAEGLYHAIVQASTLGVPMYITENGIADAQDAKRALWIERYIYALSKARQDGYDVRGFFYWSLLDNYEWDMGYPLKFGLYEVDRKTQERRLRPGARCYETIVKHADN